MRLPIIDQCDPLAVRRATDPWGMTEAEERALDEAVAAHADRWVTEPGQVMDADFVDPEMRGAHFVRYGVGSGHETPNESTLYVLW